MKPADILNRVELINGEIASLLGGVPGIKSQEADFVSQILSDNSELINVFGYNLNSYKELDIDKKITNLYRLRGLLLEKFMQWGRTPKASKLFASRASHSLSSRMNDLASQDEILLAGFKRHVDTLEKEVKSQGARKKLLIYHQGDRL